MREGKKICYKEQWQRLARKFSQPTPPPALGTRFAITFSDCDRSSILRCTPMTKRKEKRMNKSLLVDISQNGYEQMGVTVNVSRRGMYIATTEIFPAHSELCILIAAADDIYSVTGVVVWNMKSESAAGDNVPAGLGIRIRDAAPGYYQFIAAMKKNLRLSEKKQLAC